MGLSVAREVRDVPISLSYQEANELLKVFKKLDKDKDGHISTQDLRKALTEMGEKVTEDELRDLIAEVDINKNCTIEEEEFLQVQYTQHSHALLVVELRTRLCHIHLVYQSVCLTTGGVCAIHVPQMPYCYVIGV